MTNEDLLNMLKQKKEKLGLSNSDLSKLLNSTPSRVSHFLNDTYRSPRWETIVQYAAALQIMSIPINPPKINDSE